MNYSRPRSINRPSSESPRTSWAPPTSAKPAGRTVTTISTLQSAAKDYADLLVTVSQKRQILQGGQFASVAYQVLDGRVLRTAVMTKISPVHYTWHTGAVDYDAPDITIQSAFATEAELLAVRAVAKPAQVGQIDALLKLVREGVTPAAPLRVEVVNANMLSPATKVAAIKRDESGKATGFVVESIPDPS